MDCVMYLYRGNSRELKKIIVSILKSGMANSVQKVNYAQNYILDGVDIKKENVKILFIYTDNQENLDSFLSKNFSQIEKLKSK